MTIISNNSLNLKIHSLGFDTFGICAPELPAHAAKGLSEYLASGHHGDMEWMQTRAEMRGDTHKLWPDAKSVIVVGHNYAPPTNPMDKLAHKHTGNISVYAQNEDYHDVMKKKLKELARWMVAEYGGDVKVFVDTAPLMEKPLAEMAGLGWQGKHTCIVSREYGSWLFLGAVFTSVNLLPPPAGGNRGEAAEKTTAAPPYVPPVNGGDNTLSHCGTCTRCIDVCPTQAIIAPHKLDARKCISYLTIEHKGHIPMEYRKAIGNRIYGCDDCLAVCPWNKFAETAKESAYHARESLAAPDLKDLVVLDDAAFRELFRKSPIKRIGRNRFVRNVCIAIGNTHDASYTTLLTPLLHDESELVREAASWAASVLSS
jgi:epoxyqueuosine reductase